MNSKKTFRKGIVIIFGLIYILLFLPNSYLKITPREVSVNEIKDELRISAVSWTVDDDLQDLPTADFTAIQDAINAADNGDNILVYPGVYSENINVNKRVIIESIGGVDVTFVQAPSTYNYGFEVNEDFVKISGFTVMDASYAGIWLNNIDYCNISNNNCFNNQFGIVASGQISGFHHGNHLILDNNCSNSGADIFFFYSANNIVRGNIMEKRGVFGTGDSILSHSNEIDASNLVNGKPVYYLNGITGDQVPTNVGQVILVNCSDITVANLNLNGTHTSIHVVHSSYVNIENNTCSNSNYHNIFLINSHYSNITNNNCSNSYMGIAFSNNAHNNEIVNNTISDTKYGIYMTSVSAANNKIIQNTIINNWKGIWFHNSGINGEIRENNFINNDFPIDSKVGGNRYLNNFIQSTYYNYMGDDSTIWNSPYLLTYRYGGNNYINYLGNYWEGYAGIDGNNDGVGDSPYGIIGNNYDYYPLMMPFENYNLTTAPHTKIVSGPSGDYHYNDFTFVWNRSDDLTPHLELLYSYYLEGYDSEWSSWTSNTSKYYYGLANGSYIFKVRSNITNDAPAEINFQTFTPNWRDKMQIGDILLWKRSGVLSLFLNWTHAGIYIGDGKVVEARFLEEGVDQYSIEDWDQTSLAWVALLNVTTASSEVRYNAAQWAKRQTERNNFLIFEYWIWKSKDYSENAINWYCSELVWASYFNQGINLDDNTNPEDPVFPDDIMNNNYTNIIDYQERYPLLFEEYLYFHGYCPIDLQITDPDNLVINKTLSQIENAFYIENDINKDNSKEDVIIIPYLKFGDYVIEIILEPNASSTDTFSLNVTLGNQTLVLAQNILIGETPSQSYIIHVSEDGISIVDFPDETTTISGYRLTISVILIIGITSIIVVFKRKSLKSFF